MLSAGVISGTSFPAFTVDFQFSSMLPIIAVSRHRSSFANVLMYVLKPSSIHAYRRSFDPTIIGNHS